MSSKIKQVTRYGSYGVLLQDSKILLTLKKSGPYKGLWDLPGGGIEFRETPEDTLKRELLEEAAMQVVQCKLVNIATFVGDYGSCENRYLFHHIGIIYKILESRIMPDLVPEDEVRWVTLKQIKQDELTPFAKHALKNLFVL
ncbi:MAG: NUDIX domain-containing protein [Chlamydiales bacterium]|nr:NUDIX domain-containing protein [Chlamydiales bacterium]